MWMVLPLYPAKSRINLNSYAGSSNQGSSALSTRSTRAPLHSASWRNIPITLLGWFVSAIAWFVKRYIATLDRRFGRTKLSEFTGGLARNYQRSRSEKPDWPRTLVPPCAKFGGSQHRAIQNRFAGMKAAELFLTNDAND